MLYAVVVPRGAGGREMVVGCALVRTSGGFQFEKWHQW